jgi:LysM domain
LFARLDRHGYGYAPLWAPVMMLLVVALLAIAPETAIAQETAPAEDPRAKDRGAGGATEQVVVAPGDTLWSISEEHLGAGATARQVALEVGRVYALNRDRIEDPNTIFAGQTLLLPPGPQREAPQRRASRPSAAPEAAPAAPAPDKDGTADRGAQNGTAGAPDRAVRPVALPEQAAMGAVPAVRPSSTEGRSSSSSSQPPMSRARAVVVAAATAAQTAAWALVEPLAPSGPQTPRRLIGLAMMLGFAGTGCVALALAAARVARRERRRERLSRALREDWYRQAYAAPTHAGPSPARKEPLSGRGPEEAASLSAAEPEGRQTPASGRSSSSWGTARSQDKANGHHTGAKPITKGKQKQSRLRRARLPGARSAAAPRRAARSSRRAGKLAHRSTRIRRKIVAVHNKGPEAPGGWEIGAPLRRSLEGLPLRADALEGGALADLRPLVEAELDKVGAVERRRRLSEDERRRASALRSLLDRLQEGAYDKAGARPAAPPR